MYCLHSIDGEIDLSYTVSGNRSIKVEYSFKADEEIEAEIPRIGFVMKLPREFDNLNYYGRGPWENYCDRKTSAFVGRYTSKVEDQYFPYARPQENGHKTDVRWLSLTNQSHLGLAITSNDKLIEFNALHNCTEDFDPGLVKLLRTTSDIRERDFTELHIDLGMSGVAGDDSWGSKAYPQYLLKADRAYNFSFNIVPVFSSVEP